jgi:CDP-glucose 4,6-dehydratase
VVTGASRRDAGPFAGAYEGRRVFVTGHTGFKGGWLALWLSRLGARVAGYALAPPTTPSLFESVALGDLVTHTLGDVRDRSGLRAAMARHDPEIVFHLAAQPLVRRSYEEPVETYETNVLGTVNLLEAARTCPSLRAVVVVTSDKCYENRESGRAHREDDALGGADPYSSSKGCAELVTAAYRRSFFAAESAAQVASVRAGNVIGGGDWADDRIVPDCVRALSGGQTVAVRNPAAVRPWQSVLDPLAGYLWLGRWLLTRSHAYDQAWNFGPSGGEDLTVQAVVEAVVRAWGGGHWRATGADADEPHEAGRLRLDAAKAAAQLSWREVYDARRAIDVAVRWYKAFYEGAADMLHRCHEDIDEYVAAARDLGLAWAVAEAPDAGAATASKAAP